MRCSRTAIGACRRATSQVEPPGLVYLQHACPRREQPSTAAGLSIESADQNVALVASVPLNDDAWTALGRGRGDRASRWGDRRAQGTLSNSRFTRGVRKKALPVTGDHNHATRDFGPAFAWAIGLNAAYVVVEAGFGFVSGSLALLADAAHNLTDVGGLLLAWGAVALSRRSPSERHTYGLGRTSILAALVNGVALLIAVGALAWEAVGRFSAPAEVPGGTVLWVALLGIAINTGTALLFMRGREHDLNVEGAFLHMAADAAFRAVSSYRRL